MTITTLIGINRTRYHRPYGNAEDPSSFVWNLPEAAIISQIVIKPYTYGVGWDDPFTDGRWIVNIDGRNYIDETWSTNSPPDINWFNSTGEVWDMNLTLLAGSQITARAIHSGGPNTTQNRWVIAFTGTWLRT